MLKQNKGITLIALVITIVVLLVLAGVAINLSMGENGIIGKAQNAVDKYKQASQNEQMLIAKYENEIDGYISGNRDYELEIKKLNDRIAELENLNSYSTEEKVVGTWINGKPIYQKEIELVSSDFTKQNKSYHCNLASKITNIDKVISTKGEVAVKYNNSTNYYYEFGSYGTSTKGEFNISSYRYNTNNNDFICVVCGDQFTLLSATIICQYTKTTDPTPSPTGN